MKKKPESSNEHTSPAVLRKARRIVTLLTNMNSGNCDHSNTDQCTLACLRLSVMREIPLNDVISPCQSCITQAKNRKSAK